MKTLMKALMFGSFILFAAASCEEEEKPAKNNCIYKKIPGKAIIISITDAPANANNCPNNPMLIEFNFIPDNKDATSTYLFPNWEDNSNFITIHDGKNPSTTWIDRNEIKLDTELTCYRNEITEGTCTPVTFEFPDLDTSPENYCE
ncbi:MAG: hypothetical protein R6U66_07830 [Bacteroidales bacterium]